MSQDHLLPRHHALVMELCAASAFWDLSENDDVRRDAVISAIGAVNSYLSDTGVHPDLFQPLSALMIAMHDVNQGATPSLLKPKPGRGRPPSTTGREHLKLQAAVAMQLLLDAGKKREEAARIVARGLDRWPLERGDKVTWTTVDNWRYEFLEGHKNAGLDATYKKILLGMRALPFSTESTAREMLQFPVKTFSS